MGAYSVCAMDGKSEGRACGGEDGLLGRKFSLALHHQCCPPSVSAPFPRASMLSIVSARSISPCPSAVHHQLPFRFSVPHCYPPSIVVPFLRAPVLSTVNCRSVSPCPSAVHRQSAPFLRAPVLSAVSVCSVSPCTETKNEGSAVSLMLERTCFSFQSKEEKWLEWDHWL